jgi:hypothetical protein
MATKHRPMGNRDRACKDDASAALSEIVRIISQLKRPGRAMTQLEVTVHYANIETQAYKGLLAMRQQGTAVDEE